MILINGKTSFDWMADRMKEKIEYNKNKPCNLKAVVVECVKDKNKGGVKCIV